jgi:hypothetical protein
MSRLPQVNGDDGTWGVILNDYLSVSHAADGTLNAAAVTQLSSSFVPAAAVPTGGSTGQLLAKTSGTNYATAWTNPPFANVSVSTGSEARPAASFVMWVGGTTQPTNMAVGDVWMKAS